MEADEKHEEIQVEADKDEEARVEADEKREETPVTLRRRMKSRSHKPSG